MSFSQSEVVAARVGDVRVTEEALELDLTDGRTVTAPIEWYPRLLHANPEERADWTIVGDGEGVHWHAIDEDLDVAGVVPGVHSHESQASLRRWLEARDK